MKKILIILAVAFTLLTSCTTDSNYIETVKSLTFDDGTKVEELVADKIKGIEFQVENGEKIIIEKGMVLFKSTGEYIFLFNHLAPEIKKMAEKSNLKKIFLKEITWEIEGETKDGKIVRAFTDDAIIKITTKQDGDYISLNSDDIKAYNRKNGKIVSEQILKDNNFLNEFLKGEK